MMSLQAKMKDKTRAIKSAAVYCATLAATFSVGLFATTSADAKSLQHLPLDNQYASTILGPYTLSIHDGLRELIMRSQLNHLGLVDQNADHADVSLILQRLPSGLPSSGYISSGFGVRKSPFSKRRRHHSGLDIAVTYGSVVKATADGIVSEAGWRPNLGYTVTLEHASGVKTRYGHNSKLRVRIGESVRRGDTIALAGSTGRSTGSHVHYEVWVQDKRIDPAMMLFGSPSDHLGSTTLLSSISSMPSTSSVGYESTAATSPALPATLGLGGDEDDAMEPICPRQHMTKAKRKN
jgi:murein DD-endopeptidase MepM/ murein hydrolase activator NlpD